MQLVKTVTTKRHNFEALQSHRGSGMNPATLAKSFS